MVDKTQANSSNVVEGALDLPRRLRVLDLLQEQQVFVIDLLPPPLLVDLVARRLRLQVQLLLVDDVDDATLRVRRRNRRTASQAVMLLKDFSKQDAIFAIDAFLKFPDFYSLDVVMPNFHTNVPSNRPATFPPP